ncbi:MAG: hypothetical protein CL927_20970, partial [Deltaproteobacteria bacterium]|nr:hypothetical protein [Deltaproteobacteria bacterium]
MVDSDGDGVPFEDDCNDSDASISPLALEVCNGLDDDCNGIVDDGVLLVFFDDADGDGVGNPAQPREGCDLQPGWVDNDFDCNDLDASSYPGAGERCDGLDNDCNGEIDEAGATGEVTYYTDADGDGFGDDSSMMTACDIPIDAATQGGDC